MNRHWMTNVLICWSLQQSVSIVCAQDMKRPSIFGVAHVAFYASDLQAAVNLYTKTLGFEELYSFKGKDGSKKTAVVKINDEQYIELIAGEPKNDGRLSHIAFYTDNARAMLNYLAAKGIPVPEKIDKGRAGNLAFTIMDPDSHTVEIVQYEPDSWTSREKGKSIPESRIGTHIEHIGVTTRDEERAYQFYSDILGFEGGKKLRVPDGEDRIEFGVYRKPPTPEFRGSRNHICLVVPDFQKAVARIKERDPSIPIETHVLQKKNWHANLYDPDGTRIELVERTEPN
ncbi:MAG: VOC family protein [Bacteroidota bacterium]